MTLSQKTEKKRKKEEEDNPAPSQSEIFILVNKNNWLIDYQSTYRYGDDRYTHMYVQGP